MLTVTKGECFVSCPTFLQMILLYCLGERGEADEQRIPDARHTRSFDTRAYLCVHHPLRQKNVEEKSKHLSEIGD